MSAGEGFVGAVTISPWVGPEMTEDAADKVETLNPDELPQGFEMEDWTLGQDVTQLKAEVEESETVMDIRGPLKKLVYVLARHKAAFPR